MIIKKAKASLGRLQPITAHVRKSRNTSPNSQTGINGSNSKTNENETEISPLQLKAGDS